jgi:hypothetical protein
VTTETAAVAEAINLLDLTPRRVAGWQQRGDGKVVIERPRPLARGWHGVKERLSYWLSMPRLKLDRIGSFTWQRLDGVTSVGTIAEAIRQELGEVDQVEERLGVFIRYLYREGMIDYTERPAQDR